MTRIVEKNGLRFLVLEPEPNKTCELCGSVTDCRPYGPNGEQICFPCGQKDPIATKIKATEWLLGKPLDAIEKVAIAATELNPNLLKTLH